jgi:myo-inositol 2-dehydrogenase/D-chiro-inositol 1-dehydrogenase
MIRLAFVGCGAVTEEEHLPALRGLRNIQTVAVVDPNPQRLHHVADRFRIPERYEDVDSLLASAEIDAVAVCIPATVHCEVVLPLLEAGKHVFVEKPPALSLDDADRMIECARRSPSKVMVGYHMRWHRLVRQARAVLETEVLGALESIRLVWYGPRDDLNLPLWRERRDLGGGALVETAVDHFDLLRYLLGTEIEEIFALSRPGRREDEIAVVSAVLTNRVLASAVFSERTTGDIEIEVCGSAGRLRVSCERVEGLALYPNGTSPGSLRARLHRMPEVLRALPRGLVNLWGGGDFKASYRSQWRHFIDAIRNNTPVECTLADGRAALQIALAAAESATLRRPVRVLHASRTMVPAATSRVGAARVRRDGE